jgi:transcriptional regulator with XRE-family HTH domain
VSDRKPKSPEHEPLGIALRALRRKTGLTQVEAGGLAGVRSNFISQIELGKRGPAWRTLVALLRTYDADFRDLQDEIDLAGGIEEE